MKNTPPIGVIGPKNPMLIPLIDNKAIAYKEPENKAIPIKKKIAGNDLFLILVFFLKHKPQAKIARV